jgi:hypothetical protein
MKKTLLAAIALAAISAPAFGMKHAEPTAEAKVAAACKDKKAGAKVTLEGKEVVCPKTEKKDPKKDK